MNQQDIQRTSLELNKVKSAFETWRANKDKGSRIPQSLWKEAIALYPEFSVSKISTTLSLSYTDLKKRAENKVGTYPSKPTDPAFMELNFSSPSPSISECVVEMEDGSGSKMKMCFRGKTDFDLLELGKSFWKKRS